MQGFGNHSSLISKNKGHKNLPVSPFSLTGSQLITARKRAAFTGRMRSRDHLMNSKWR